MWNLNKLDKFLVKYNLLNLNEEKTKSLNSSRMSKESIFNTFFSFKEKTNSVVLQENAIIILKNKSFQLPKNVPKE